MERLHRRVCGEFPSSRWLLVRGFGVRRVIRGICRVVSMLVCAVVLMRCDGFEVEVKLRPRLGPCVHFLHQPRYRRYLGARRRHLQSTSTAIGATCDIGRVARQRSTRGSRTEVGPTILVCHGARLVHHAKDSQLILIAQTPVWVLIRGKRDASQDR